MNDDYLIRPAWPAPPNIRAFSTTRRGGVSTGPWRSFNLGYSSGDDRDRVRRNREKLAASLPGEPLWMQQVHGNRVFGPEDADGPQEADASFTSASGQVLAVMTADCLPVLLCDEAGSTIGIAHAGWRGLARGVVEATVTRMGVPPAALLAWLGPAISGRVYEVGEDVRAAFADSQGRARLAVRDAFAEHRDRWRLDICAAARAILHSLGVERVYGGDFCTFSDSERFFSHRRDGVTGRMASLIWKERN